MRVTACKLRKNDHISIDGIVYKILASKTGKHQKHGFPKVTFAIVNVVTTEETVYTCSIIDEVDKLDPSITKRDSSFCNTSL